MSMRNSFIVAGLDDGAEEDHRHRRHAQMGGGKTWHDSCGSFTPRILTIVCMHAMRTLLCSRSSHVLFGLDMIFTTNVA